MCYASWLGHGSWIVLKQGTDSITWYNDDSMGSIFKVDSLKLNLIKSEIYYTNPKDDYLHRDQLYNKFVVFDDGSGSASGFIGGIDFGFNYYDDGDPIEDKLKIVVYVNSGKTVPANLFQYSIYGYKELVEFEVVSTDASSTSLNNISTKKSFTPIISRIPMGVK